MYMIPVFAMVNIHNSKSRGGWAAPLRSQVRWRVLAIIVTVGVLGAMHVHHRALHVDVAQLIADGQQMSVAVDHVSRQRMTPMPHAA